MKLRVALVCLVAPVLLFVTRTAAQSSAPPGLAKAREDFLAASTKVNKPVLERLIANDVVSVGRNGRIRDKKTVIQEQQPLTGTPLSVEFHNYSAGSIVLSHRKGGNEMSRVFQVWVPEGNEWRLVAHQGVPSDGQRADQQAGSSSPLPPSSGPAADIKAIDAAIENVRAGNRKGDAKNFAAAVTEQFVGVTTTRVASKQDRLNELTSGKPQPGGATVAQTSTRIYGELAVTNRVLSGKEGSSAQTIVHVKQGGRWLRAAVITTPIVTKS